MLSLLNCSNLNFCKGTFEKIDNQEATFITLFIDFRDEMYPIDINQITVFLSSWITLSLYCHLVKLEESQEFV